MTLNLTKEVEIVLNYIKKDRLPVGPLLISELTRNLGFSDATAHLVLNELVDMGILNTLCVFICPKCYSSGEVYKTLSEIEYRDYICKNCSYPVPEMEAAKSLYILFEITEKALC